MRTSSFLTIRRGRPWRNSSTHVHDLSLHRNKVDAIHPDGSDGRVCGGRDPDVLAAVRCDRAEQVGLVARAEVLDRYGYVASAHLRATVVDARGEGGASSS